MLKPANFAAIITEANGKATAHTYSPSDVVAVAYRAEAALEGAGLPKTMRAGAVLVAVSGGQFSRAYQRKSRFYRATRVKLERRAAGWRLIECAGVDHWTSHGGSERINYTEAQCAKIAAVALDRAQKLGL